MGVLELNLLSHYDCVIEFSLEAPISVLLQVEDDHTSQRNWMHLDYATCSRKSFDTELYRFYLERSSRARWHWHCSRACTDAGLPSVDRKPYMHLTINLLRVPRDGSSFVQDIVSLTCRNGKNHMLYLYFFICIKKDMSTIIDTHRFNCSMQFVFLF